MSTIEYLRSFKLGEYAIFDLASSFLGIYLLAPLLSKIFRYVKLDIPKLNWLYFTIPLSIVFHILVGNYTPMTKYFIDPSGHYLLKIFISGLFILGVRNIKVIKK